MKQGLQIAKKVATKSRREFDFYFIILPFGSSVRRATFLSPNEKEQRA